MRVHYRAGALDDIAQIHDYRTREHSARVAAHVMGAIRGGIDLLAANPEIGNETNHERAMRRWPIREYLYAIFYSVDRSLDAITITRVVAGARVKDLRKP
jgi:plasmid stabilization system protein ParE